MLLTSAWFIQNLPEYLNSFLHTNAVPVFLTFNMSNKRLWSSFCFSLASEALQTCATCPRSFQLYRLYKLPTSTTEKQSHATCQQNLHLWKLHFPVPIFTNVTWFIFLAKFLTLLSSSSPSLLKPPPRWFCIHHHKGGVKPSNTSKKGRKTNTCSKMLQTLLKLSVSCLRMVSPAQTSGLSSPVILSEH